MKKLFLLIVLFVGLGASLFAQTRVITGTVTPANPDDGEMIGVSVTVKGTIYGTVTDVNGKYTLQNVPSDATTLVFSFVGMKTQEIEIGGRSVVNCVLESELIGLDEIVVTAMGISRSEKTLGYAATTVKNDELAVVRNANVATALAGKVAGVQVQTTSSDPGAASSVIIRGFSSINGNNQPLYVVDGVPLQSSSITTGGHTVALSGLSNISSDDIESMTILKGAAATALYGSRAANGVVVITTKSGKRGNTRNFTISYNGGMQLRQVSVLPTFQNDFGQGWNGTQTFIENGSWGPRFDGSDQVYGPIWNGQQLIHEYSARENNVKEFFEIGKSINNSIAISGVSTDNSSTYYMSYSNSRDNGIIPTDADSYERNTFAFRGSFKATEWLKFSSNVNVSKTSTDVVGSFQGTSVIDGLLESPRDVSFLDKQDLTSPFNTPEAYFTPYGITNPYWAVASNYNHTNSKQIYGKLQGDVNPFKNLTLTYRFGFDYSDYDMKMGEPKIALDDALIDEDYGYAPSNMNQDGYVYARYNRSYELNHDFLANYDKGFGDFSLTVNAGVNVNERASTTLIGETDVLTFPVDFWDLSNGATKTTISESQWKRRLVGLFGDVTLGFRDMLYLNITARNDWSSTLPAGANSYAYPGATLSWIFTNMLPKNDFLTFGKLRLAYGQTGNDAGVYMTTDTYAQATARGYYGSGIASFPMNGVNAFLASVTSGSSTLKPEMTTETEAGLNLQFFKGRIGLDAAVYNKETSDQIFTLPIDPSTGYSSQVVNFGTVRNRGIELLLSTTPVNTRHFRWDVDFNFAVNRNKVLSLPESLEGGRVTIDRFAAGNDAVYMYAEEGMPMGVYYTYRTQHVEDANSPYYGWLIVDENGQPVLDSEVSYTGKNMNNKWTGGISTSISAYGFTLGASLDVRYGGTMFSRTRNIMQFTGNGIVTTYNDRNPFVIPNSVQVVTSESGAISYVENTGVLLMADSGIQNYFNDYGYGLGGEAYLLDRTFAKIRNINLTWDLPSKWMRSIRFSDASVSVFVNNPFVWTAAENHYIDPETTTEGSDLAGMFGELYSNPSCRIYGFNFSVNF